MDHPEDTAPVDFDELIVRTLTRGEWIMVSDSIATNAALHLTRMHDEEGARVLLKLWERVADDQVLA